METGTVRLTFLLRELSTRLTMIKSHAGLTFYTLLGLSISVLPSY
jgi:hypothetical protein